MSMIKLWIVVVSCFSVGNCAGESRKIDEAQYKNHRTSSLGNDTAQNHAMLHKTHPVYPIQVHANLSNVKDFGMVKLHTEQKQTSKATEVSSDMVQMFFTTTTVGKKKPLQGAAISTTPIPSPTVPTTGSIFRTAAPSTYIVTARNSVSTDTKDLPQKSPVYSGPRSEVEVKYTTSSVDFRGVPAINENEPITKTKVNGSKIRRVLKTQNQASQSSIVFTTTTTPQMSPSFASNKRNFTSFAISAKVNTTAVTSSKPFATVLVPKYVLDSGVFHQQEDSFRPIVPPIFTPYKSPSVAVDTNSIVENRRVSDAAAGKNNQPFANRATAGTTVLKLKNYGHTKPLTYNSYKVKEYVPSDVQSSIIPNHSYSEEQDRSDRLSVINKKRDIEKSYMRDHHSASSYYENEPLHDGPPKKVETFKYGFVEPREEPFKSDSSPMQIREFYQATEWPGPVKYENFDERSPTLSSGLVHMPGPISEPPSKEYFKASPSSFSLPNFPKTQSNGPELVMGDLDPKDVLKSLLQDMLKSKKPAEIKPKSPTSMDEIIDSYVNQQNVDYTSQDSFNIQTDMNCNLRSSKYITDGQCVSTKPVVEAVCAHRCLVSASSLSQRHRSSIHDNQQVEALQCTDGDVKMIRVQLKCRNGNMFNHIIKVVANCSCKLHPKQPLTMSNSLSSQRAINPEIMAIAAGQFR
ncbi:uncharacterized protein LOC112598169 [Melanaphis sacchari]|uniref:uncharacterized protein LOC112598169 n=1 Tax=Melanaphis sacchari TaxID=742174 RepID=UPI000DC13D54|nr:uncharacterized protein LOC112598169 [Melanaphis sacchari]